MKEAGTSAEAGASSTPHMPELQSVRGLAALLVAVAHSLNVHALPPWKLGADVVLNPHAAVIVFFVLSGYVLTLSLQRTGLDAGSIGAFWVRRLFRIYPATWCASLASLLLILALGTSVAYPPPSDWFGAMEPRTLTAFTVVLSMAALDGTLIVPIWTIFVELVGSALLPLMLLATARRVRLVPLLIVLLAVVTVVTKGAPHRIDVLGYMVHFALGMGACLRNPLGERAPVRAIAAVSAIGLLCFRSTWFLGLTGRLNPIEHGYNDVIPALAEGFFAVMLVSALASRRTGASFLRARPLVWLGDVSFGVYLLHFPIMTACAAALSPAWLRAGIPPAGAALVLVMLTVALTLTASALSYRFVEVPAIGLGRRVGGIVRRARGG